MMIKKIIIALLVGCVGILRLVGADPCQFSLYFVAPDYTQEELLRIEKNETVDIQASYRGAIQDKPDELQTFILSRNSVLGPFPYYGSKPLVIEFSLPTVNGKAETASKKIQPLTQTFEPAQKDVLLIARLRSEKTNTNVEVLKFEVETHDDGENAFPLQSLRLFHLGGSPVAVQAGKERVLLKPNEVKIVKPERDNRERVMLKFASERNNNWEIVKTLNVRLKDNRRINLILRGQDNDFQVAVLPGTVRTVRGTTGEGVANTQRMDTVTKTGSVTRSLSFISVDEVGRTELVKMKLRCTVSGKTTAVELKDGIMSKPIMLNGETSVVLSDESGKFNRKIDVPPASKDVSVFLAKSPAGSAIPVRMLVVDISTSADDSTFNLYNFSRNQMGVALEDKALYAQPGQAVKLPWKPFAKPQSTSLCIALDQQGWKKVHDAPLNFTPDRNSLVFAIQNEAGALRILHVIKEN